MLPIYDAHAFISLLYSQGADGVRGLKGNKGEKVILEFVYVCFRPDEGLYGHKPSSVFERDG